MILSAPLPERYTSLSERCAQVAVPGGAPLPERDAVVDILVILLTIESNVGPQERPVTLLVVL